MFYTTKGNKKLVIIAVCNEISIIHYIAKHSWTLDHYTPNNAGKVCGHPQVIEFTCFYRRVLLTMQHTNTTAYLQPYGNSNFQ